MGGRLRQYVYISRVDPAVDEVGVARIIGTSQENNARNGISGFLIFNGRNFLQLLEGEEASLLSLMSRIAMDRRHSGIVRLEDVAIARRVFPDWSMRRIRLSDRNEDRRRDIDGLLPQTLDPAVRRTILNFSAFN